jgi:2-polyprenyl-3-methyl-5-hydroxy-6-metoxy-1,4-benzoquinol methylase
MARDRVPPGTKDLRLVVQRAARVRFATDLRGNFLSRIGYRLEPADGEGEAVDLPFSLEPA